MCKCFNRQARPICHRQALDIETDTPRYYPWKFKAQRNDHHTTGVFFLPIHRVTAEKVMIWAPARTYSSPGHGLPWTSMAWIRGNWRISHRQQGKRPWRGRVGLRFLTFHIAIFSRSERGPQNPVLDHVPCFFMANCRYTSFSYPNPWFMDVWWLNPVWSACSLASNPQPPKLSLLSSPHLCFLRDASLNCGDQVFPSNDNDDGLYPPVVRGGRGKC